MLTPEQVAHFEAFGFILLKQAFSSAETAGITREFESVLAEDRGGQPFTGEKRQAVLGFLERRPLLARLVETDIIYQAMEQLLGPNFVWVGSDGNLYVGDTHWHPDSGQPAYRFIKVAFYLDPVTRDTGALRVIPGSHRPPLYDDLKLLSGAKDPTATPFGVAWRDVPNYALESQPGDVVMFNQATWHAAFGGKTGRRMFTLNFAAAPTLPEHEARLRKVYNSNLEFAKTMQGTPADHIYEDGFLHSDRPRVRSMTAKLLELGLR
jgi:hypothetical protein